MGQRDITPRVEIGHDVSLSTTPVRVPALDFVELRRLTDKIANSRAFMNSERMIRFLRYAVEHAASHAGDRLKEYIVGVEIFDRDPAYDPRVDPIVRVEARRLRAKLRAYYESEGRDDDLVIEFPKGTYTPSFRWRGDMTEAAGRRQPAIAVLPLTNLSRDARHEYFSDGLTEEIIHALTKVEGLRVMAWRSAAQLKGREQDIGGIRDQLRVGFVLRGSVRRTRERLRITVQLIDTATSEYLWSEVYDRPAGDVFLIEEEISRNIVRRLMPHLVRPDGGRTLTRGPSDLRCHNLCLRGRFHWNKRTVEGLKKSIRSFEEAIEIDAACVRAYTGLADAYIILGEYGWLTPAESTSRARNAVLKAMELDPWSAEAYTALALIRAVYEWQWKEAEALFLRAIELNPGYATAHHWYGMDYLAHLGRMDEAHTEIELAHESDPLSAIILESGALLPLLRRDYDAALQKYSETLDLDPTFYRAYGGLGRVYMLMGEYDRAIALLQKARSTIGNMPNVLGVLGQTYGVAGRADEAQSVLAELQDMAKRRHVPATSFALVHIGLGDHDAALTWLERGCEGREPSMAGLKVHPAYDALRPDPRFGCILKSIGFSD